MKLALRHYWLFARIELGLSRAEFNALTYADWKVALKLWNAREQRKQRREDELVARLALFINLSVVPRKPGAKLPQLSDFLPKYGKNGARSDGRPSNKELIEKAERFFSRFD